MARVLRLIEISGSDEFVARTIRMSHTHERSIEVKPGCFVTGTLLPIEALPADVDEAIRALKAHAVVRPELPSHG